MRLQIETVKNPLQMPVTDTYLVTEMTCEPAQTPVRIAPGRIARGLDDDKDVLLIVDRRSPGTRTVKKPIQSFFHVSASPLSGRVLARTQYNRDILVTSSIGSKKNDTSPENITLTATMSTNHPLKKQTIINL
jgi:hypothetical protein